jgi:hypothetical protein
VLLFATAVLSRSTLLHVAIGQASNR